MKQKIYLTLTMAIFVLSTIFAPTTPVIRPVYADDESAEAVKSDETSILRIRAINPGYTVDGKSNSNEFIEIEKLVDEPISLTNLTINYTNGSGNTSLLYEFPAGSQMVGESILLRLASSPEASQADLLYTRTLAFSAGPLELKSGDSVLSSVCWTGKKDCYASFSSSNPTTLIFNDETEKYEHSTEYTPSYDSENSGYQAPPVTEPTIQEETVVSKCKNLEFSEILSYYETSASEQFVEFYNPTSEPIDAAGCQIKYKNKTYTIGATIQPDSYYARYATDFKLTKNPTSSNTITLIDSDGETVDELTYYNGQKKATSLAQFDYQQNGSEQWMSTYAPTPGEPNQYQQFKTCTDGKVINEETGNCVKTTTPTSTLEDCPEGKYRNPLTGRCKSYSTSSTQKPCAEGYERNPETNRCRKVSTNTGADYPLTADEFSDTSVFIAIIAVAVVSAVALIYVIFQFRPEIASTLHRLKLKFKK